MWALGLPQVIEYSGTTRAVNYSSSMQVQARVAPTSPCHSFLLSECWCEGQTLQMHPLQGVHFLSWARRVSPRHLPAGGENPNYPGLAGSEMCPWCAGLLGPRILLPEVRSRICKYCRTAISSDKERNNPQPNPQPGNTYIVDTDESYVAVVANLSTTVVGV